MGNSLEASPSSPAPDSSPEIDKLVEGEAQIYVLRAASLIRFLWHNFILGMSCVVI